MDEVRTALVAICPDPLRPIMTVGGELATPLPPLHCFELTSITAHCSVLMPKHPSEEAGPSDRCAMPSWPTPPTPTTTEVGTMLPVGFVAARSA